MHFMMLVYRYNSSMINILLCFAGIYTQLPSVEDVDLLALRQEVSILLFELWIFWFYFVNPLTVAKISTLLQVEIWI